MSRFARKRNTRKSALGTASLKLKFKRNPATKKAEFTGGDVPLSAKLKNGSWSTAWGLDPNSAVKGQSRQFPITVQLGSAAYGVTVTVATGIGLTVTWVVPNFPSLVAVMVAVPGATPVTTPLLETVARPAALVDHVIVRPESW